MDALAGAVQFTGRSVWLAKDCAERRVLGDDVEIDIHAFDEINTRIRTPSGWPR